MNIVKKYAKPLDSCQWLIFITGVDVMTPKMIEIKCPYCHWSAGNIPAGMGDKTIKCKICGKYIRYKFYENEIEIVNRPERVTSSGLTFC